MQLAEEKCEMGQRQIAQGSVSFSSSRDFPKVFFLILIRSIIASGGAVKHIGSIAAN
jgi:hypothetical protein